LHGGCSPLVNVYGAWLVKQQALFVFYDKYVDCKWMVFLLNYDIRFL